MNGFCRLLEMYLQEGHTPDVAYRLAWQEWQYMKQDALEFYYEQGNYTQHYQSMPLKDIPRWIEAYQFTHPDVLAISVKVWMNNEG